MNFQSKKGKTEAVIDDEVVTGFSFTPEVYTESEGLFFYPFWSSIVFRWRKEF